MGKVANIFISYARQDASKVEELYEKLKGWGYRPWLDQKDILPGELWKQAIQRADVFLACLSKNAVDRRGMIQRELKQALDIFQEKLSTDIYVIPVRLEKCDVPDELKHLQWVDLFENDGFARLSASIQKQMRILEKATAVTRSKQLSRTATPRGHTPKISWPPRQLTSESVLLDAKSTLLLVGTSLSRAMRAEISFYRQWLDTDPDRKLGLMFLNPNSPHSSGRSRPNVYRSNPVEISSSLDLAYKENRQRKGFLPVIYEGPYRYTARASDLGMLASEDISRINILTSSRTGGTAMGFEISLSSGTTQEAYKFYESELLDLWKTALANPPGHGISLMYRGDFELDSETLHSTLNNFIREVGRSPCSVLTYPPDQYHVTLTSICETQSILAPFRISNSLTEESLPAHFGDFLCELLQVAHAFSDRDMHFVFDRISVDETGKIRLESRKPLKEFAQLTAAFREKQAGLLGKYANNYPEEPWTARKSNFEDHLSNDTILPHVTIGVAFDDSGGLPLRLREGDHYTSLPNFFEFVCRELCMVYYAYPSLLRCIGDFIVSPVHSHSMSGDGILRRLGIDLGE